MSFPLSQLFCVVPPPIISSHAHPRAQSITDGTFILPLIQSKNPSKLNAEVHQTPPGSSSLLLLPLHHQAQCLQAIHKTSQQFHQHLKAEHLDQNILQFIVLQLQNDFALLRYLLFSSVGTIPIRDISAENSVANPPIDPNHKPTSNVLLVPCAAEHSVRRFTPEGAVRTPRANRQLCKRQFRYSSNRREAPTTQAEHLTSRISIFEKLFADETATYTSIAAGIHSQYFSLYDLIRRLEAVHSDFINWKIALVNFVFDSAKVARPSSDPLIEPAKSFSSPIFKIHPHGYNFFVQFYLCGIGPATGKCASILFNLFPGYYENLFQWPFSKLIYIDISDQLDPLNTWTKTIRPDQDPAEEKPTISTEKRVSTIIINNFIPRSKHLSETEGFPFDGARFIEIRFSDPLCQKPQTQTSHLFLFP